MANGPYRNFEQVKSFMRLINAMFAGGEHISAGEGVISSKKEEKHTIVNEQVLLIEEIMKLYKEKSIEQIVNVTSTTNNQSTSM